MSEPKATLKELHGRLGYRPLSRSWAKVEIVLGLGAAAAGLLAGVWAVSRAAVEWYPAAGAFLLLVLGCYLALAGHRSHLYQSSNELTAYLADAIGRTKEKG